MKKYFDAPQRRLIYLDRSATPAFWDGYWAADACLREQVLGMGQTRVSRITERYLRPADGIILEGGCGRGEMVASLVHRGYRVIGVDSAERTVRLLRQNVPELDIRYGDVRHLEFPDGYFAGYWSIGVIEHFWDGYEEIALEMSRVIQPGGYLFLTFPYMSPVRIARGRVGLFARWQPNLSHDGFYQFALDSRSVINHFRRIGFRLVKAMPFDFINGSEDLSLIVQPILRRLFGPGRTSVPVRVLRKTAAWALSPIACHCQLLVLNRTQ